jgi:protein SCO1/2
MALSFAIIAARPAVAQVLRKDLQELAGVGIVERRGEQVPPDLRFKDSRGRDVRMGDFFDGERPVVLVMAYFDCPLLCTLVLNDVQRCLNELNWTAGSEFRVVTVSFDHRDTPASARAKQATYLAGYAHDVPEDAWMFLTGDVENIRGLASAVGFHYRYLPETGEFSHSAALIILSPDGKVSNYLEKMVFPASEVKQALMEAADGKVGSIFERVAHFCFSYNFSTGKYTPRVVRIMQVGALGTLAGLALFVGVVGLSRSRRTRAAMEAPGRSGESNGGGVNA